jgi:TonB family protein
MSEITVHHTPERRANPRTRLQRLAYIRVEPDNGAIVVDASSEGIRFHAVAPLHQSGNVQFSFSLSGNRRVEAAARLVWADDTKKSGGLAFSSVPAEVVEQLLNCCSTPNDPPLPQRPPVTPRTPVSSREWPEWEEADSSFLVMQALASAGQISRAANQRPRRDLEAWNKKVPEQKPVAARPDTLPARKTARSLPMSKATLTAFLMGVLLSIPILFVTKLVTSIVHRPLAVATQQTQVQVQLPPAAPTETQPIEQSQSQDPLQDLLQDPLRDDKESRQTASALIAPPQLLPRKAKSAKNADPRLSEINRSSGKDHSSLAETGEPNNTAGPEHPGYRSTTGGSSSGGGRVNGFAGAFATANPAPGDSGSSGEQLKMGGFASSTVGSESPKTSANAAVAAGAQPLIILDKPTPVYTEEARRLAIEGEVLIEVVFSASGQVRVVRVVKSLGHGLDEAAMNAAQRIRFEPALQGGQPVDVPATVHITFQLAF